MMRQILISLLAAIATLVGPQSSAYRPAVGIEDVDIDISDLADTFVSDTAKAGEEYAANLDKRRSELRLVALPFDPQVGSIRAFYDGARLVEIVTTTYRETGRRREVFYFRDDRLVVYEKRDISYTAPASLEESRENSLSTHKFVVSGGMRSGLSPTEDAVFTAAAAARAKLEAGIDQAAEFKNVDGKFTQVR